MARAIRPRYSRLRVLGLVTFAVFVFVLVSACSGDVSRGADPSSTPKPGEATATSEPIFSSNEEALAAATEAYAKYLEAADRAGSGDQEDQERFLALTTGAAHDNDVKGEALFLQNGWTHIGQYKFDSIALQSLEHKEPTTEITTYLCLDLSETDVLGRDGKSVVPTDRPVRLPLEIVFIAGGDGSLLISESKVWAGRSFC